MQPGEGAAMGAHPIRPARVWYWVAGTVAVAAVLWFALGLFLGFRALSRQVDGFQRVPIPGRGEVSFEESGGYTLYYEGVGASDEQVTIPSFTVSLTSVASGEELSIRDFGGSATYGVAGHSGRALGTFRIEEPGRFLLQTEGEPQTGQANVAVGSSVGPAIFRTVSLAIVGTLILLLGGAVLAVVVAVRRNRARRVLLAPAAQPVASWGRRPHRRGGLPTRAGGTSFATGTASGGPSMSPTAAPKGLIPSEPGDLLASSVARRRHPAWQPEPA